MTPSVERATTRVGEPVGYGLTIEYPRGLVVALQPVGDRLGDWIVESREHQPPRPKGDRTVEFHRFVLTGMRPGPHPIPSPAASYRSADGELRNVRAEPVSATVVSVLPKDWEGLDIRDAKPLLPTPLPPWAYGLIGMISVIVCVAVGKWMRRRPPPPPPDPPDVAALRALDALERESLPAQHRFEGYYVALSQIIRGYVEARFGLRAPEMTTEEFLQAAVRAEALTPEQRQLLQAFLAECDLVKFAQYRPSIEQAQAALAAARRFVEETRPRDAAQATTRQLTTAEST